MKRLSRRTLRNYLPRDVFTIADEELGEYLRVAEVVFDALEPFAAASGTAGPNIEATRELGRKPTEDEDPYNAIVRWCRVKAEEEGILSGMRLGLKDNIAIAGIPMTCGSRALRNYVPGEDSVLTNRLLAEGAEIVAVTNMENFAMSGGGDTSCYGPILNPMDVTRTASGSSGGSAAALYYENIDITFGTDQGGSIRLPAAWCGVLGLKPTFGLVPYTGIMSIDQSFDHAGPLARTAEHLALALQAVAGKHDSDPRQGWVMVTDYQKAVTGGESRLEGVTLGLVKESLDPRAGTEDLVRDALLSALDRLCELGATVKELSIPEHITGVGFFFALIIEGQCATLDGYGNGYHWRGKYTEDLAMAFRENLRKHGDELPPQIKLIWTLGRFLRQEYGSTLYARAQNCRRALREAYDAAFRDVSFLILPTSTELPHAYIADQSIGERILAGWTMGGNSAVFNYTGHPALSMPAAEASGLPVGVQIVGPMFSESAILRLAKTYEGAYGWLPRRDAAGA
jgi:amidase